MHRRELRRLSRLRIREARILLRARAFAGAYYLAGYAVECALKACAARKFRSFDIPDRRIVGDLHTHDLERLLEVAGLRVSLELDGATRPGLRGNWHVVKDWRTALRYNPRITPQEALAMYSACTERACGILSWLRSQW